VTRLYAQNYAAAPNVTEEQKETFLKLCLARAGADTMITPREMLRDYMTVLNILMQNPDVSFEAVLGNAITLSHGEDDEEVTDSSATEAPDAERRSYTIDEIEF
jgi:hypothetical protein